MRHVAALTVLLAVQALAAATPLHAQVQRNPTGTETLGGPVRNPGGVDGGPAQPERSRDAMPAGPVPPDRPPLGSDAARDTGVIDAVSTAPGHTLGVGPNTEGSNGTGANGGGAPNTLNPAGSNGSAVPQPLSGSRPNGGSVANGSKGAPMQANGVRKVE